MKKQIVILNPIKNLIFSVGGREIKVSETMPVKDAELIAAQYPGQYVKVVEVANRAATPTKSNAKISNK